MGEASPESATYLLTAVAAAFVLLNGDGDVITAHRLLTQAIEDQARPYRISGDTGVFEAVSGLFLMCRLGGRPELWMSFHAAISGFAPDVPKDLYLLGQTCADPVRTAACVLPLVDAAIAGLRSEADHLRILMISSTAHFTDRQPGCREALWRVVREGRRGSGVAPLITALDHLGLDAWLAGQWDQAQELADEGLELSLAHGYPLLTWSFRYRQALVAAARGAYDGAHTLTDEMLRWAAPRRIGLAGLAAHHVRSVAALGRGDFEDAYQHATAISPAGVLASHVPLALWVLLDLVEAAVRTGRRTEAAAHITAMRDAHIAAISPRLALLAAGSQAIAAPDSSALGLFEEALAIPGVDHFPFDLARVQLLYGERLRRARATKESRPQLAAALEIFERLGAGPWASRAASELRATGQTQARADQPASRLAHAAGTPDRDAGRRRPDQQGDRPTAFHVTSHRRSPPVPDLSQTRHYHPGSAARRARLPAPRAPRRESQLTVTSKNHPAGPGASEERRGNGCRSARRA